MQYQRFHLPELWDLYMNNFFIISIPLVVFTLWYVNCWKITKKTMSCDQLMKRYTKLIQLRGKQ